MILQKTVHKYKEKTKIRGKVPIFCMSRIKMT